VGGELWNLGVLESFKPEVGLNFGVTGGHQGREKKKKKVTSPSKKRGRCDTRGQKEIREKTQLRGSTE